MLYVDGKPATNQPVTKGLHLIEIDIPYLFRPIAKKVFDSVKFWDTYVIPALEKAAQAQGVNLTLLRGNFFNPKTLKSQNQAALGYTFKPRKGYDSKLERGKFFVVVA